MVASTIKNFWRGAPHSGSTATEAYNVVSVASNDVASKSESINQNGATSGLEMCFAVGSQYQRCRGSQPKHVSNPESVIKKFKPHLIYNSIFKALTASITGRHTNGNETDFVTASGTLALPDGGTGQ